MTHDELLAKMYLPFKNAEDAEFFGLSKYRTALRAVVELHKPNSMGGCNACEQWTTEGPYQIAYPCPTIQAIEKELG